MADPIDYVARVDEFLRRRGVRSIIGFSGGYMDHEDRAKQVIEQSMKFYQGYPVAILTGGTKWNLPGHASAIAQAHGLPVIGVLPERGLKHKVQGLDLELVVPSIYGQSEWCDESQLFGKLCDGIELIGGGPGAAVEVFQALKISLDRIRDGKTPKYIAPIAGFGGVEELLYKSSFVNATCMPQVPFEDGASAAKYLMENLR